MGHLPVSASHSPAGAQLDYTQLPPGCPRACLEPGACLQPLQSLSWATEKGLFLSLEPWLACVLRQTLPFPKSQAPHLENGYG